MKPAVKILKTKKEFLHFVGKEMGFKTELRSFLKDFYEDESDISVSYYGHYTGNYIPFMDGSPSYCGYVKNAVLFYTYSYTGIKSFGGNSGTCLDVYVFSESKNKWYNFRSVAFNFNGSDTSDIDKLIKSGRLECRRGFNQLLNILRRSKDVDDFKEKCSRWADK